MAAVTPTDVLGFPLHPVDQGTATRLILQWAQAEQSRAVCAANVHMVMEAWDDPVLQNQLRDADLSIPDGRPLGWALGLLGINAEHVRGADLTLEVCHRARNAAIPIGLYGSTPESLEAFRRFLHREYPALKIPFAASPPFRQLTQEEDIAMSVAIRESGARILLVSLGCPKQERWMMEHRGQLPCVMLGVGAAFDFLGGTTRSAPRWMQRSGLEWLFRLAMDPRRLWKRYLKHNPRFVVLFGMQWFGHAVARLLGRT